MRDTSSKQIYNFVCNQWLTPDEGEDFVKYDLELTKELQYKYTLRVKSLQSMRDKHIWLSIFACPRNSTFTRVQRLSCAFSFVMSAMLVNIMFYDINMNRIQEELIYSVFKIGLRQVTICAQSALILFPSSLLTVLLFRYASPHNTSFEVEVRQGDDTGSNSYSSSESVDHKDCIASTYSSRHNDTAQQSDASDSTSSDSSGSNANELYDDDSVNKPKPFILPWWCVYIGWALTISTYTVSSYIVLMYGLTFGYNRSLAWLTSFLAMITNSVGILQPLKVAAIVITMTFVFKTPVEPIADIMNRVDLSRSCE